MDPNATLSEMTRILRHSPLMAHHVERLADLVEALEGWLGRGGFAPVASDWRVTVRRARRATKRHGVA